MEKPKKSRQTIFESLWIPIELRKPPDEEIPILMKMENGNFGMTNGKVLNTQRRQLESGAVKKDERLQYLKFSGYFCHSWMRLY